MLGDVAIERYSRQILLPEVGGRGQERLGAARVAVVGGGAAATVARDLLARAGVGVLDAAVGAADVVVDLTGDAVPAGRDGHPLVRATIGDAGGVVDAWRARPCPACADRPSALAADGPLAAPTAIALGALVAAEALIAVLGLRAHGRRQTVDLSAGVFAGAPLAPRPGCATCASAA